MKTFTLTRQYQGYSRGEETIEVQANTLEEAIDEASHNRYNYKVDDNVVRDDRDFGDWEE